MHDYRDLENVQVDKRDGKEVLGNHRNEEAQGFVSHTKELYRSAHIWMSEQGVELEANEGGPLRLKKQPGLQKFAAKDFLRLGRASEHVEWAYYYEYRGPRKAKEFDSALLNGEGHEPEDWRPTYCVLALGLEACPPKTTTKAAIAGTIKSTGSTVSLGVEPQDSATTYFVEYGTTEAYGTTTTMTALPNETGEQSATVDLSGLEPCTTYHYQAEAENEASAGTPSLGGDQTFKTLCGDAAEVAAGGETVCVRLLNHHVQCWGAGDNGILGDGVAPYVQEYATTPVAVTGITDATKIAINYGSACALLATGHVECWGIGSDLGDGTSTGPEDCSPEPTHFHFPCSTVPVEVDGITNAVAISGGAGHVCALLSTGTVECWGSYPGLEEEGHEKILLKPAPVSELGEVTAINGGSQSDAACAVLPSQGVSCWGSGELGAFGTHLGEPGNRTNCLRLLGL
jgi:hypothetical protein